MSEKDRQTPTVATFYANETDINELTVISPDSAAQVSERSFRPPAAEPPDREDRPLSRDHRKPVQSIAGVARYVGANNRSVECHAVPQSPSD
jgi:hypothetical protein